MVKASDHNPYQVHLLSLSLSLSLSSVVTEQRVDKNLEEFMEGEVKGKQLMKMISNLFLLTVLNQVLSFDSLLNQHNCHVCVYYECKACIVRFFFLMNTDMEEGVFFIKEAICIKIRIAKFVCDCASPQDKYLPNLILCENCFILFPKTMVDIFCFLDFHGFAWNYISPKSNIHPCMENSSVTWLTWTLKLLCQAGWNVKKNEVVNTHLIYTVFQDLIIL